MDSRKLILLVGALVVAGITAFLARSLIAGSAAPQAAAMGQVAAAPVVDGPEVLVATRALPVGTILDDRMRWHGLTCRDPIEPDYDGG